MQTTNSRNKYEYAMNWLRHNGCLISDIDTMTREDALGEIARAEAYYQYVIARPDATREELHYAQLDVLEAEFVAMAVEHRPSVE